MTPKIGQILKSKGYYTSIPLGSWEIIKLIGRYSDKTFLIREINSLLEAYIHIDNFNKAFENRVYFKGKLLKYLI